jgi:hypothetical protein
VIHDWFLTVGRAFTARLARRKAAPYGGYASIDRQPQVTNHKSQITNRFAIP